MNVTTAEYFTFNAHNSLLLIGQTGCGKSVLEDKLIKLVVNGHTPRDLQFVLLDMTGVDFWYLRETKPNYILADIKYLAEPSLAMLEYIADQSVSWAANQVSKMTYILIEECDIAIIDQERFDNALIKLNRNAKAANIKIIYSTSCPAPNRVSGRLARSFDLILAGELQRIDRDRLELPVSRPLEKYEFTVTENLEYV